MSHKSVARSWNCRFYGAFNTASELYLYCQFTPLFCFHFSQSFSSFNVSPLMKSGGSVIFSIVPWVSLLPNTSRSSQNSAGPTDRNSLPCRYQSPPLLTIILICFSLLFSLPEPQCLLPALRNWAFTVIVPDSQTWDLSDTGLSVTTRCKKLEYFPH